MPSYLVESYLPRSARGRRGAAGRRAGAAAEQLTNEGTPVTYVRTTFLPDDETCFHLFDAGSVDAVDESLPARAPEPSSHRSRYRGRRVPLEGADRPGEPVAPDSEGEHAPDGVHDPLDGGHVPVLEVPVRVGDVVAGDAEHRPVEVEDGVLREERGDLGGEPAGAGRFLDDDAAAGSSHGGEDRLLVERLQGAEVEHLDRRLSGERVGSPLAHCDHRAPRDERRVRPSRAMRA